MLRFLLDEHLSPSFMEAIRDVRPEMTVTALQAWRDGAFIGADDETILRGAAAESLTLVTFDLRSIPPLLRDWTERGIPHSGVVFIHSRSIPPSDRGGMVQALVWLWDEMGDLDWAGRVAFLRGA